MNTDTPDTLTQISRIIGGDATYSTLTRAEKLVAERDELAGTLATITTERDNSRALNNQILNSERGYYQTLADRLGVPYETAADAAALCDALAPRLAVEADAVKAAANVGNVLPDALMLDDDGHLPTPARVIHLLASDLRASRRSAERASEALNNAKAEADTLRLTLAATQADLRVTGRAHDSWRDAAAASARALSTAAAALADVAAIR